MFKLRYLKDCILKNLRIYNALRGILLVVITKLLSIYFSHFPSLFPIFEVKKSTISKLKKGYYTNISLDWKLTGPIVDRLDRDGNRVQSGVKQTNQRIVKKMNIEMPGLKVRLTNYLEYYIPGKNK